MTVLFALDGQEFTALNGGPVFKFNEAISLQINCETQDDIAPTERSCRPVVIPKRSSAGAEGQVRVSWQVVPTIIADLFKDANSPGRLERWKRCGA